VRQAGNWQGDGQSTVLWGDFASRFDAEVHTVDLDPLPARRILEDLGMGEMVQAHEGDSVRFLHDFAVREPRRQIDLLYLDSYDLDIKNPYPSALHHIMELAAARPCLGPGSIVAIDDNLELDTGGRVGKGMLVGDWFHKIGIPPLHLGYQFIWRF
jgi:predicted O-methyltransferase YrrM